jgi:CubicO group peptidase (beta-lactamase class C family)
MYKIIFSAFLFCFFSTADAVTPDSVESVRNARIYKIDSFITRLHKKNVFNGTVLVAEKGDILYHRSVGLADLYYPDSIKNDYPYQMASVSKPVTAAAIMLLVQQGEITLDDKIVKYLPELMTFNRVRIRHLLNHTSGIPEYIYRTGQDWKADTYMRNDDLLRFLSRRKYGLIFSPGSRFDYCNTNYALLASIIERVTEKPFDVFVRQHIFDPLGMHRTRVFNPDGDTLFFRKIKGYSWNGRRFVEYAFDHRNGIVGDKGIFSTADDMMRFALAFTNEDIWCNETCSDIFSKTRLRTGVESEYGAGWRMREWDGLPVTLHYGFWNSFRTGLIHFPESDITFVILNNLTGAQNSKINNRDMIIRELMKIMFVKPESVPVLVQDLPEPDILPESEGGEGGGK